MRVDGFVCESVDNSKCIVSVDGFMRGSVDLAKFIVRVDGFVRIWRSCI